ncbi:LysE family transporter [Enemella evansiae]|uniref:LysE family transporter n=1 Tax=Enemella evansiae TaxID=2016499 RepID=UPI000B96E911|nr:LysE family transporter [Enemella evansiae]OYO13973.1 lysine transporter LysE [Enemella evansiae]TDO89622.1 threonine/homoserine/homoserine lactone efflux protein [Enemella evansiae]
MDPNGLTGDAGVVLESFLTGLWVGYGLAIPLGGVAVLMIEHTARTSFGNGAAAAAGAVTADTGYAVAATLGGAALAAALHPWAPGLRVVAAAILLLMALHIAVRSFRSAPVTNTGRQQTSRRRSYLTYLSLTAMNPWPVVYFTAAMLGATGTVTGPGQIAARLLGIVLATASWQLLLAGAGSTLGRLLTGRRGRRITGTASACLIAVLAIRMVIG